MTGTRLVLVLLLISGYLVPTATSGRMTVRVIDASSGRPIADATVTAEGVAVRTRADGRAPSL